MSNQLDNFAMAYGEGFKYALDNRIILHWYPRRVIGFTSPNFSLLELGIGHGYTTNLFSEHFKRHVVVDASLSVISQFKSEHPRCKAEIVHAFFEDFDTDEMFDVIVMGFVLEHVENPRLLLNRFKRFLKPAGQCFIAVPNAECLHRRFGHAAGLLLDIMALGEGDLELGHRRLYTRALLEELVTSCGYRIVRQEGVFLKPLMTEQLQNLDLSDAIFQGMCIVGIEYPELSAGLFFEAILEAPE